MDLKTGDPAAFVEPGNEAFFLLPSTRSVMELYGVGRWMAAPVTLEEMNDAIMHGWAGLLKDEE